MRRPADQAKLLFLYLLRSSAAALATGEPTAASAASKVVPWNASGAAAAAAAAAGPPGAASAVVANGAYTTSSSSSPSSPHPNASPYANAPYGHRIALRLATRKDVPGIQRCNLATLPENYNANFYAHHLRRWPELALVAERVPPGYHTEEARAARAKAKQARAAHAQQQSRSRSMSSCWKRSGIAGSGNLVYDPDEGMGDDNENYEYDHAQHKEIVAYVLGKVDERIIEPPPQQPRMILPRSTVDAALDADDEERLFEMMSQPFSRSQEPQRQYQPPQRRGRRHKPPKHTEKLGHVTSLAVLPSYRRLGLAASLMDQLHRHMRWCYDADAVGLHVRVSNGPACRLYGPGGLGYGVADVIPRYYGDGEDAYFMRREFGRFDDVADELEAEKQATNGAVGAVNGGAGGANGSTWGNGAPPQPRGTGAMTMMNNGGGGSARTSSSSAVGSTLRRKWNDLRWSIGQGSDGASSTTPWRYGPAHSRLPRWHEPPVSPQPQGAATTVANGNKEDATDVIEYRRRRMMEQQQQQEQAPSIVTEETGDGEEDMMDDAYGEQQVASGSL